LSRQIYYDVNLSGMKAHTGSVVGIVCDATNTLLITGGYDGYVKVCGSSNILWFECKIAHSDK
jgi:U3 small nucleolar RNA-associated protein 21